MHIEVWNTTLLSGLLTEISAITRMSLDATGMFVHSPPKLHTASFGASACQLGLTDLVARR
jgi:hypothetical protein